MAPDTLEGLHYGGGGSADMQVNTHRVERKEARFRGRVGICARRHVNNTKRHTLSAQVCYYLQIHSLLLDIIDIISVLPISLYWIYHPI